MGRRGAAWSSQFGLHPLVAARYFHSRRPANRRPDHRRKPNRPDVELRLRQPAPKAQSQNKCLGWTQWPGPIRSLKLTVGDDLDLGWSQVTCPSCHTTLDPYWFAETVEEQFALTRLSHIVQMSCCGSHLGFSTLCCRPRQRISGFVLSYQSMGAPEKDRKVTTTLEQVLGARLAVFYDFRMDCARVQV